MQIDPTKISPTDNYKLLTGTVIPRPIGWISSINENGIANLAPFSYFNAVCDNPPCVMFSVGKSNGINKDTLNNVLKSKQFVVNMVSDELLEQMNITAQNLPPNESEFDAAGLTKVASTKVKPPRVLGTPIALECEMIHHYTIDNQDNGGATIIVGEVKMFHFADDILLENHKINTEIYKPMARLAGSGYMKVGEGISMKRG
jgi:flavin reductase (DIM6/NTAB) family NADH-FMN oxidoreductase RutF